MNITLRTAAVGMAAIGALSLGACASRPKPAGPQATSTPQYPPPPSSGPAYSGPREGSAPVTQGSGGPAAGSVQDFVVNVGDRVYFGYDQYDVREDARPLLQAQASWLQRYPAVRVRIEGNCDERGTREYNFALGARRAGAVKDFLASHGVSPDRIDTVSYGKERPVDTGSGEQADAHNRNAHTSITQGAS